jgi:type I restriction enzyme S subunit
MFKAISDLCRVEYGAGPNKVRSDDNTGIEIYGTGGKVGFAKEALFNEPLVVVARKGTLDNPILVDKPCWVIDTAYAAIPNCDVDVRWLYYQLLLFDLKRLNESTGVPSISRDYLKKQKIAYQEFDVQRKIGDIISAVDNVIEKTEAAIDKYQAIKAGMMQDLFTRGIDTMTGMLRPTIEEAPELYKESELGWIPKEWVVTEFQDACLEFINGGTPSTKNASNWVGSIPWITGADFLESFEVGFIRRHINEDALRYSSSHLIREGNILLVTRTGVGKLAIAPFDVAISQDITGIILDPNQCCVEFFYYY